VGGMFCGFIAYRITKYRKQRKKLMDALP
jgi:hypothetical protein